MQTIDLSSAFEGNRHFPPSCSLAISRAVGDLPRLTVFKSSQHIYAQIIDPSGSKVLAATSTLDKSIKSKGRSVQSAKEVGEKIADLSINNGIKKVIFDRSGYRYHGRIKMIAEAAREKGLEI